MQRVHWPAIWRVVALVAVGVLFLALPSSSVRLPLAPGGAQLWWLLLALPLIAHGLAHATAVLAPFSPRRLGFTDQPWSLASRVTPHSLIGRAFGLLWLAAAVTLVTAGVGLLLGRPWWSAVALVAAPLSLADILIWWRAVPPGARVGAAFDVLVLLAALQSPLLLPFP